MWCHVQMWFINGRTTTLVQAGVDPWRTRMSRCRNTIMWSYREQFYLTTSQNKDGKRGCSFGSKGMLLHEFMLYMAKSIRTPKLSTHKCLLRIKTRENGRQRAALGAFTHLVSAFRPDVQPGCSRLLLFTHTSINEVQHWWWMLRSGSQTLGWGWGLDSVEAI